MLRIRIRFPLGVYHALSAESFGRAEWPPSPVRLVGALLAATHESEAIETESARELLQRLCEAAPPEIVAPTAALFGELGEDDVAEIRGASRWAPRNHDESELKKKGVSPRNLARERTEVFKGGVAVGDRPIEIRWPELELSRAEIALLKSLVEEITFFGTSRSPVVAEVDCEVSGEEGAVWRPAPGEGFVATEVRVPIPTLLDSFDRRHAMRTASKPGATKAPFIPLSALGATIPYMPVDQYQDLIRTRPIAPEVWGDMIVLELDGGQTGKADGGSELRPHSSASYLVARAFREALLGAFGPVGSDDEAPPVLRGHGREPHAAIVPLPFVHHGTVNRDGRGKRRQEFEGDGLIRGIAVVLPHRSQVPDVDQQRLRVEQGLVQFVVDGPGRRSIRVPGAGTIYLKPQNPALTPMLTLRESLYREPSNVWQTVTPVVHAHRRTSSGPRGIERQIAVDCQHAGLPAPIAIEELRGAPFGGSPNRVLPASAVPAGWRTSMLGPTSHLRLTFERPIAGPVLLGRARHFGLGLLRPAPAVRRHPESAPDSELREKATA